MILRADKKVAGGKLLRAALDIEAGIVMQARLHGDFFAHPEELFEAAEALLSGLPPASVPGAARAAFSRPGLEIFGAGPDDIAAVFADCLTAAAANEKGAEDGRV